MTISLLVLSHLYYQPTFRGRESTVILAVKGTYHKQGDQKGNLMQNKSTAKQTLYSKATQNEVWILKLYSPLRLHHLPRSSYL